MIKTVDSQVPAIAVDGTTPLTPEQIVEQLRLLSLHVPDFGPLPIPSARALRTTANLDPEFVYASIDTIGASQQVASAVDGNPKALGAESTDVARWSTVETALKVMFEGVAAANLARRHRLGLTALQVYGIARQLVRKKEHADLLPHVERMRSTNRFGVRKRETKKEVKPPQPAPVPAPGAPVKSP